MHMRSAKILSAYVLESKFWQFCVSKISVLDDHRKTRFSQQNTNELRVPLRIRILTQEVLLSVHSQFAQNLSSSRNHSRTLYLTATNLKASWLVSACVRFICLFNHKQPVRHPVIDYIVKKFNATAQQWCTDKSVSALAASYFGC